MASRSSRKSKKPDKEDALLPTTLSSETTDDDTPKPATDHYNLVYFICMLMGSGLLIAYNFLVSAPDYFAEEYPEDEYPDYDVNFYIVPAYTYTNIIVLILSIAYGERFSFTSRIVSCFLVMGVAMFFPLLTHWVFPGNKKLGFYIVMGVAGMCGVTTAILNIAIVAFCNYLPVSYIMVSVAGQSVAGISAGVIRIAVNLIQDATSMSRGTNALIYFGIGGAILIACGLAFLVAIRSAFVKFHLMEYFWTRKFRTQSSASADVLGGYEKLQRGDTQTILRKLVDNSLPTPKASDFAGQMAKTKHKKKRKRNPKEKMSTSSIELDVTPTINGTQAFIGDAMDLGTPALPEDDDAEASASGSVTAKKPKEVDDGPATLLGVLKKIRMLALAIFLCFFINFLPFPAMVTSLKSQYDWVNNGSTTAISMPVFLVLLYNCSDYVGRQFVAGCTTCSFSKRTLWIGCAWRILLYPLFIVLYKGVIENDWVAYGSTAVLGVTNGHFACLCFMWAPSLVNAREQELCGGIMSFSLVMGITAGSNITLLLTKLNII